MKTTTKLDSEATLKSDGVPAKLNLDILLDDQDSQFRVRVPLPEHVLTPLKIYCVRFDGWEINNKITTMTATTKTTITKTMKTKWCEHGLKLSEISSKQPETSETEPVYPQIDTKSILRQLLLVTQPIWPPKRSLVINDE